MSSQPTLLIYGSSDDLIEVEGAIEEEFNHIWSGEPDEKLYLAVSDGTLLQVRYDDEGMWRFTLISRGKAAYENAEATDEEKDYSDRVTLTLREGEKFRWVLLGDEVARVRTGR